MVYVLSQSFCWVTVFGESTSVSFVHSVWFMEPRLVSKDVSTLRDISYPALTSLFTDRLVHPFITLFLARSGLPLTASPSVLFLGFF